MTLARELVTNRPAEVERTAPSKEQSHPFLDLLSGLDRYIARWVREKTEPPSAKVIRKLREDTETHLDLIMFGEAAARAVRIGQLKPNKLTYRRYLARSGTK